MDYQTHQSAHDDGDGDEQIRIHLPCAQVGCEEFAQHTEGENMTQVEGIGGIPQQNCPAVFLDATLVRMLLVPATMELLGEKNWWLPAWLDRILPNLNVEGTSPKVPEPTADQPITEAQDAD